MRFECQLFPCPCVHVAGSDSSAQAGLSPGVFSQLALRTRGSSARNILCSVRRFPFRSSGPSGHHAPDSRASRHFFFRRSQPQEIWKKNMGSPGCHSSSQTVVTISQPGAGSGFCTTAQAGADACCCMTARSRSFACSRSCLSVSRSASRRSSCSSALSSAWFSSSRSSRSLRFSRASLRRSLFHVEQGLVIGWFY